jgi:hypothetical protein
MAFLALVDAPVSSESMKFPVFSLLTREFEEVGPFLPFLIRQF